MVTEREHVVFDGAGAVETPAIFRDGLGELAFHRRFGIEAVDEFGAEDVVGCAVLVWQEADVARQAVAEIVPAGVGLAGDGSRPC